MNSTADVHGHSLISRLFPTILDLPDFYIFTSFIVEDILWDVCEINAVAYKTWF